MKRLLLSMSLLSIAAGVNAQSWADTVAKIEQLFSRYTTTTPGAELAISRNGKVIFSKAWGMADLEHGAVLTTTSPTEAGSVSKQFTAAAILLLEQQGKLSLEDDVRKYIPELPDYGHVITLRHMMQHTSGLKDWGSVMELAGWGRGSRMYTNEYALYVSSLQRTLNNVPGAEYIYSNSNYTLMAVIVQRVSGLSLADYTRKHIFEPAGMKQTSWRDNNRRIVPGRAIAYIRNMYGYLTTMPNENGYGNGGLLTTAEDLLTWNDYYLSGRFGSPSLLAKQTATRRLNGGRVNTYAAGLVVDSTSGWQSISHDGATAGYRSVLEYFPEMGLSIAWLSNTSAFDSDSVNIVTRVRRLFLPVRPQGTAAVQPREVMVPAAQLESYAGWYHNPRTGAGLKLFVQEGRMSSLYPTANLAAITNNVFMLNSTRMEVDKKGMWLINASGDSTFYNRVEAADVSARSLQSYAGVYYSPEAEATYHIEVRNDRLFLLIKPTTTFPMTATYKDGFDCPFGPVEFVRNSKGAVTGLRVSISRARKVSFEKATS